MENDYNEKCLGQNKCDINLSSYMRTGDDIKDAPKHCTNKFTQIYIQTQCMPSEKEAITARQVAVMAIFLGMLMSLIFTLAVDYLKELQKFLYKKWDINTATPADFTIKMKISQEQYDNYLEGVNSGENTKPMNE